MRTQNIQHWLRLSQAEGVGPVTAMQLVEYWGSVAALWEASLDAWNQAPMSSALISALLQVPQSTVDQDCQWAEKPGHSILTIDNPDYPEMLRVISAPPLLLYVKGDPCCLSELQVAIVGSRRGSYHGRRLAHQLSRGLSNQGVVVTSGLARGIDAAAHQGALAGSTNTIAVLGSGVDVIYPSEHHRLASRIIERGALVSEYRPCARPQSYHFPQRNRIISGLSCGVVVVEATRKSGSLITAEHALDQGREVFAVPGVAGVSSVEGCHALLKSGATLVECAEDVLRTVTNSPLKNDRLVNLASVDTKDDQGGMVSLDSECQMLLECVDYKMTTVDQVMARSGLNVAKVNSKLLIIELKGYITRVSGGYVRVD